VHFWHGHEMIFGFALAIIAGTVLTALPSWAGTPEIQGARLAVLAALWLLGRAAMWALPWLPPPLPAIADLVLVPVLLGMLTPQLLRVRNRWYLLLLPILLALFGANLAYHIGITIGDAGLADRALRGAVYAIVVLYILKGGVLTPIFTGNALREAGRGDQARFSLPLEVCATGLVVLLAALDLGAADRRLVGAAALATAVVHALRTARWKGWRVADQPLVAMMHLGFAWLVFAFALKAAAELTGIVPETAWLHAFTVGSLGLMMLGLMNRVSLRHTGRALAVPRAMRVACAVMFASALLRLAATVHGLGPAVIALAALLWAAPFVVCLVLFGPMLLQPSLHRAGAQAPSTLRG